MIKRIDIHPERNHTFSSLVVAGDYIYTSHIPGYYDETGVKIEGIENQTAQCLKNLQKWLGVADACLDDVVKTTVYLKELGDFKGMNKVYGSVFTNGYPARMTATTQFLDEGCLIMIEAVAYRTKNDSR